MGGGWGSTAVLLFDCLGGMSYGFSSAVSCLCAWSAWYVVQRLGVEGG